MKLLKTQPHLTDSELKSIMESQKQARNFLDWQIIYSVQTNKGKKAEELASILGVSKHKIYKVIQEYNKYGKDWRKNKNWGGRREARCNMTLEAEAFLLQEVGTKALRGEILTYTHIKSLVEERAGKKVSDDYIWDMFKRHGWKKKVPKQSHPKSNKEKKEEYKKNSKRIWLPNH